MYQKILVPLDGSNRAEAILPHVIELARCTKARIIFLQVIEPMPLIVGPDVVYPAPFPGEEEARRREAGAYLAELQTRLCAQGIETGICIEHGQVVEQIIGVARREEVGLIAMASHGRTGFSQMIYGSVAAGVLHRIDRPLLLIRSQDGH